MWKSSFQADLKQFVELFGSTEAREKLAEGTQEEVAALIEECPQGAAAVLAVGLRRKDTISRLAEAANVTELAEQALDVLARVEGRKELLERCLDKAGKSLAARGTRVRTFSVEPMFDIQDGELMVHWVARTPDGRTQEAVELPLQLLRLFPALGEAVQAGWEGMSELGWSMTEQEAREYAEVLKACADTVESLSSLLPSEVVKGAPQEAPEE